MGKKKQDPKNEYDLNQSVIGIDGNPELLHGQLSIVQFEAPADVSYKVGKKTETKEATGLILNSKPMTFRNLILRAIRGQKDESPISIEKSTKLMLKCMADKVELDSDEKSDINKCVEAMKDPLYVLRVKQLWGDM